MCIVVVVLGKLNMHMYSQIFTCLSCNILDIYQILILVTINRIQNRKTKKGIYYLFLSVLLHYFK